MAGHGTLTGMKISLVACLCALLIAGCAASQARPDAETDAPAAVNDAGDALQPAAVTAEEAKIVPDPVLRQRLRDGLGNLRHPARERVRFAVNDGVVTMTGRVRTYQDKALVEAVARTLPGVRRVNSEIELESGVRLVVRPADPRSPVEMSRDEKIRRRVLRCLASVSGVRLSQLQVEVFNGVAVVGGVVADEETLARIKEEVKFTKDVTRGVFNLVIVPPAVVEEATPEPE